MKWGPPCKTDYHMHPWSPGCLVPKKRCHFLNFFFLAQSNNPTHICGCAPPALACSDAALAKMEFRWRTCLVIRELELEISALAEGRQHRESLKDALNKKERVGDAFNMLRLARQKGLVARRTAGAAGGTAAGGVRLLTLEEENRIEEALAEMISVMECLDDVIAPAIEADGASFNKLWGYLTRAGVNDRSQLQRQMEKYSDVYTSRVSNFGR